MSDGLSSPPHQPLVISESLDLDGVIDEILSRLPAKSLLRFRCVCKSWRTLISDPYFIRKHLNYVNTNISTGYSLLAIGEDSFRSVECEAILKCLHRSSGRRLDFPVLDPPIDISKIEIVGSCNGLICLSLDFELFGQKDYLMLWNPCTGEYHVLPKPPFHLSCLFFWGFGYVSITDDYKLLIASYRSGHEFALVFTLKTGAWRKLEVSSCFPVGTMAASLKGCLVKESLYWSLGERDEVGYFASKVVSFDLAEEKFHEIPFPCRPNPVERRELIAAVGILDNCLIVGFQSKDAGRRNLRIWVMKDHGVKESWTEFINIPSGVIEGGYECISENGEALFRLRNILPWGLVLCNLKEKTLKILFGLDDIATYVESLVSPSMGSTNGASL